MELDLCGVPQHRPRTSQKSGQFARCLAAITVGALAVASNAAEPLMTRPDWSTYFMALRATGTMVVRDEGTKPTQTLVYNIDRANQRYSPASTFKIPHAAFALEAGLVRDEFQVFKWDGTKRSYEAWNADQDLRSSMRDSVVWVYQGFAA